MKARVISTGKIVEVKRDLGYLDHEYKTEEGERFAGEELDFNGEPDYWTRLEHQAAIAAMQGILSNPAFPEHSQDGYYKKNVVNNAYEYAHALVEKYKKEERK